MRKKIRNSALLFHYECFNGCNTLPAFALSGKLIDFYAFKYYSINIEYWLGILLRIVNIFLKWGLNWKINKNKICFFYTLYLCEFLTNQIINLKKWIFWKEFLSRNRLMLRWWRPLLTSIILAKLWNELEKCRPSNAFYNLYR